MNSNRLKKIIESFLIAAILTTILSGCTDTNPSRNDSSQSNSTAPQAVDSSTKPVSLTDLDAATAEKVSYFDFAVKYRLDYLPVFAEGEAPVYSDDYLFWAFAINLDNWGKDKGTMTREYVDTAIHEFFQVGDITHIAMSGGWKFDSKVYTAIPSSIAEKPIYVLTDLTTYEQNNHTFYEASFDVYGFRMAPTEEEIDRARQSIAGGGVPDDLVLNHCETVCYYINDKTEKPVFVSHTASEIGPAFKSGLIKPIQDVIFQYKQGITPQSAAGLEFDDFPAGAPMPAVNAPEDFMLEIGANGSAEDIQCDYTAIVHFGRHAEYRMLLFIFRDKGDNDWLVSGVKFTKEDGSLLGYQLKGPLAYTSHGIADATGQELIERCVAWLPPLRPFNSASELTSVELYQIFTYARDISFLPQTLKNWSLTDSGEYGDKYYIPAEAVRQVLSCLPDNMFNPAEIPGYDASQKVFIEGMASASPGGDYRLIDKKSLGDNKWQLTVGSYEPDTGNLLSTTDYTVQEGFGEGQYWFQYLSISEPHMP